MFKSDLKNREDNELWDIYDRDRNITGKIKQRKEKLLYGEYHLVVHICVFNSDKKLLVQKRQPWKKWPCMWDLSAGGSALSGEDSRTAAIREVREELGIDMDELLFDKTPEFSMFCQNAFDDVWIVEKDISDDDFKIQKEEVSEVKWIDICEYMNMVESGDAVPHIYVKFISDLYEKLKKR